MNESEERKAFEEWRLDRGWISESYEAVGALAGWLARASIAAKQSAPVAWVDGHALAWLCGGSMASVNAYPAKTDEDQVPLYATPPSPTAVEPKVDEAPSLREAIERYLRVCRSGGMPRELSDKIATHVAEAERLGYFATLAFPTAGEAPNAKF